MRPFLGRAKNIDRELPFHPSVLGKYSGGVWLTGPTKSTCRTQETDGRRVDGKLSGRAVAEEEEEEEGFEVGRIIGRL
jgi:hypothetical protein